MFWVQGYPPLSAVLLGFSILTASINYVLYYVSFKKIKDIAEKEIDIKVVRNGNEEVVRSS